MLLGPKDDEAYALAVRPDGRLVTAGVTTKAGSGSVIAVVRHDANGSLDTSFGPTHSGIGRTPVGSDAKALALALEPDGTILAAGSAFNGVNSDFALVRHTTGGIIDSTFGIGGKGVPGVLAGHRAAGTTIIPNSGLESQAGAIVCQPGGKPIVAGTIVSNTKPEYLVLFRHRS